MLQSLEADIYPLRDPAAADLIDDGSQFHRTFGYYAHGVGPETARGPAGWQDRLVKREIPPSQARAGWRLRGAWSLMTRSGKVRRGRERD